ncbi:MAG: hypothetical protein A3J74_02340 [Elusimicrobia bacterium RIFCSPHIGHO2_02_FULL_57_9]|nr:MAG: hypothetical protein A3J74_02340 [Elusimicrobia bacterium RIFCSPHIGHO2_02_FULL_57_9]
MRSRFSLSVEVPDSGIVNVGTAEDPVAGMLVNLKWRTQTAVKDGQGKTIYFLQGDGVLREIAAPIF